MTRNTLIAVIIVTIALAAAPWLNIGDYIIGVLTMICFTAVFAMSWDLLFGYAGEVNFGPSFLIGLGAYGAGMAEVLARDLAQRRLVILSGMARGVDTCAHRGALDAHGATVAVWGTGIDVIYPKENKRLAEQIVAQGGAIVSEFPLGTFPAPQNFPIRNRTLSGIAIGVLVVEAAEHSGTRITARCALEQGRDVYAVPGNATSKNSWGPNTLIKQGAKLTATWEDVWEDLPTQVRLQLEDELAALATPKTPNESSPGVAASLFSGQLPQPPLSGHERLVLEQLRQDESIQLDDLIERLEPKLTSGEIFTALFELELSGRIRQMPGKNYLRSF